MQLMDARLLAGNRSILLAVGVGGGSTSGRAAVGQRQLMLQAARPRALMVLVIAPGCVPRRPGRISPGLGLPVRLCWKIAPRSCAHRPTHSA